MQFIKTFFVQILLKDHFCQIQMLIEDKEKIIDFWSLNILGFMILILNLNFDRSKSLNFFSVITFSPYCQVTMIMQQH